MRRLFPRSLAGQTILVLFVGLTVSHAISMVIHSIDREEVISSMGGRQMARRIANIAHLVSESPLEWRELIVAALNDPAFQVSLSPVSRFIPRGEGNWRTRIIRENVERQLLEDSVHQVIVQFLNQAELSSSYEYKTVLQWIQAAARRIVRGSPANESLRISVELKDGEWINFSSPIPRSEPLWANTSVISVLLMALAVVVLSVWVVRKLTAPLEVLAWAARRLGKDVDAPPLLETGPIEVRQASRAFNEMQERLRRFIDNRTRMLAAISHDLRTPITLLRLRAELVEDEELQTKMVATLDEMEAMIASTLAFARDDAESEETRNVDISALLGSICDDMSDAGLPVRLETPCRPFYECRPRALKRALTNLIENAVKYGGDAYVRLEDNGDTLKITVQDNGPGIPADQLDQVLTPFYRVEQSRSQETGGIGLGLSVAQTVVQAHGGQLALTNRKEGGLRVSIELPR